MLSANQYFQRLDWNRSKCTKTQKRNRGKAHFLALKNLAGRAFFWSVCLQMFVNEALNHAVFYYEARSYQDIETNETIDKFFQQYFEYLWVLESSPGNISESAWIIMNLGAGNFRSVQSKERYRGLYTTIHDSINSSDSEKYEKWDEMRLLWQLWFCYGSVMHGITLAAQKCGSSRRNRTRRAHWPRHPGWHPGWTRQVDGWDAWDASLSPPRPKNWENPDSAGDDVDNCRYNQNWWNKLT